MNEEDILNAEITDVTATIDVDPEDPINPTDRVFEALGHYVKVRKLSRNEGLPFGVLSFSISASQCGADGKALPWGEGYAIAPASTMTVQPDRACDVAAELLEVQREAVRAMLRAINNAAILNL